MTNRQERKVRYVKCPKCARTLQEPEHVPLYICGGCNTVLQAKYYRKPKEALVPTLPIEDVVQSNGNSNGNGNARDAGNSGGSSQRSSNEQSSIQNEENNEKTAEDYNSEQIGDGISASHTSLSVESGDLEIEGGKQDLVSREESGETSDEDKEAEQLLMENETKEGGTDRDQYDGIEVEKQDDEEIGKVNSTCETSTRREVEVIESRKSPELAEQDENDGKEECEDVTALDEQKEVEHENFAKEAFMPVQSEITEEPMQFEPVNVAEGNRVSRNEINYLAEDKPVAVTKLAEDGTSEKEQKSIIKRIREKPVQSEITEEPMQFEPVNVAEGNRVSGNEINYLAEDKPVAVTKLAEDDTSEKEQKSIIKRIREKLASVTISNDGPLETEVQEGNENSLPETEASLGAFASHCDSVPLSNNERVVSDVLQDADHEISLLDNVMETSRQKIENFHDSAINGSGQNRSNDKEERSDPVDKLDTYEKIGNMFEEVPRSPTKRSPAYDGSVSSCDGNDDRIQPKESFSENDAAAGYASVSSIRIKQGNSRHQPLVKSSSWQLLDGNLKPSMEEEQEPVRENDVPEYNKSRPRRDVLFPPRIPSHRRTSDTAFETGSSSSFVYDDGPSHGTRHHHYGYEDQEPFRSKTRHHQYVEGKRFSEAGWRHDFLPIYYNDETSGEFYPRETYQGYHDIRRRAEGRSFSSNIPRTQYPGEVYNGRYQIHDHHMHRHLGARPWSAQLPSGPPRAPPAAYYRHRTMPYMDLSVETGWDQYGPYPPNPRRFLDPEPYGWSHDAVYLSDDPRHHDRITKRSYMREKRHVMKRHLRPMSGGAPFVTCRFCFKILQLPEEFLLSKTRKIHKLKCGACSNVLQFSLGNESSLTPRLPYTGESAETNLDRDTTSHHSEEAHINGKDLLQHNSFGALGREKTKDVSSDSVTGKRHDKPNDINDAASASNQSRQVTVTWRIPSRRKSPLHQLMGYSSPHDLLAGQTLDDEE